MIYKYKKQTFANLPNSGVYTKVYSAYIQVMGKFIKRQPNEKRQTREPPKDNFDSSLKIFCKIDNQNWRPETNIKTGRIPKSL